MVHSQERSNLLQHPCLLESHIFISRSNLIGKIEFVANQQLSHKERKIYSQTMKSQFQFTLYATMALWRALLPGSTGCNIFNATSIGAPLILLRQVPWKTKPNPPRPNNFPCLITSGRTRYRSPKSRNTCQKVFFFFQKNFY